MILRTDSTSAFTHLRRLVVFGLASFTFLIDQPSEAQVLPTPGIASGWGDTDERPQPVPTREAALGPRSRVQRVIYFDVDQDGLDDELVTIRGADGSDEHCEVEPTGSSYCDRGIDGIRDPRSSDGRGRGDGDHPFALSLR